MTFVYDIGVKKFAEILEISEIQNSHFDMSQFKKNYSNKDMVWCMLFDDARDCVAAAAIQPNALGINDFCLNEVQSLKKGFGKKIIATIIKKYGTAHNLWLMANPEVDGDALLKIYRSFHLIEKVVEDSVYGKPVHFFYTAPGKNSPQMRELLTLAYGNKQVRESTDNYDPPYTLAQIKANYPDDVYLKLANDPVHRWRAETGIELIHKEPTDTELERIWKNWQLMSSEQKDISDEKSLELFGVTNNEHYRALKIIQSAFDDCIEAYLSMLDIDLSYIDFKTSKQPVYNNGEPCFEYKPEECAGDWTSLGWIRMNPDFQSAKDHYGISGISDEDFAHVIVAHELAHEIWHKHASLELKKQVLNDAQGFTTPYLKTVKSSKLPEETFCEWLATKATQRKNRR